MRKFYITTPIYYVNAAPHIGHAYTTVVADCLARYWRDQDVDVYFLTGTDEHGQKIQKAADEKGISPQEFTDQISPKFKNLWKKLDIKYDDFIRTTEDRHKKAVQKVFKILKENGDIYQGQYGGWYCVPCETFWTENQVEENKICPDCNRPVEHIEEANYFFKLSKYQNWLIQYLKDNPEFIFPKTRFNEVKSFLENNELTDLCISRPKSRLNWGIPLPFDSEHVAYVWFDALINYISALGFADEIEKFERYWPADIHIMAKDIIRQHAIYWPIMLKALDLEIPKKIVAHGWWKMGDIKMSKSLGNVVNPLDIIEEYGVDSFRYFLLRDVIFGSDGNFSQASFEKRFNGDLANDLGNLVHRTVGMVEKYCEGKIPNCKMQFPKGIYNDEIKNFIENKGGHNLHVFIENVNFTGYLDKVWNVIKGANKFVEQVKPWELKKQDKMNDVENFLKIMIEVLRFSANTIAPFMPSTKEKILEQIGGTEVVKGKPLFPRLEKK